MSSTVHPTDHLLLRQARGRITWRRRKDRLDEMQELLLRIDTALIVRDPGTARSADAYEGLRRQVVAAAGDRRKHIVQLTEFAEALRRGDNADALRSRTEEWLLQANVIVITDPSLTEAFEFIGDGDGIGEPTVIDPAYVDGSTNSIIRRGLAERTASTSAEAGDEGHVAQAAHDASEAEASTEENGEK